MANAAWILITVLLILCALGSSQFAGMVGQSDNPLITVAFLATFVSLALLSGVLGVTA